jgi:hypothetical protein
MAMGELKKDFRHYMRNNRKGSYAKLRDKWDKWAQEHEVAAYMVCDEFERNMTETVYIGNNGFTLTGRNQKGHTHVGWGDVLADRESFANHNMEVGICVKPHGKRLGHTW